MELFCGKLALAFMAAAQDGLVQAGEVS